MTNTQILNGMQYLLRALRDAKMPLYQVVAELKAQMDMLTDIDPAWRQSFDHKWFGLEEVNALALDRGEYHVPAEDIEFVEITITEMIALIDEVKGHLKESTD